MSKKSMIATLGGVGVALLVVGGVATGVANSQAHNLDLIAPREIIKEEGAQKYIDFKYTTQAEALKNAQEVTQRTAEEGYVLLKNQDGLLPLAAGAKVNIFGYYAWHNNMSGGEDPATTEGAVSLANGLKAGFQTNESVNAIYEAANGELANPDVEFAAIESSFGADDVAVIVLKRNSGEGNDQTMDSGSAEFNRTGLSINNAEIKLIDYVNKHFSKVVVIINSANTMELGFLDDNDPNRTGNNWKDPYSGVDMQVSSIKSAIWVGPCGSQGGTALARVMKGEVNPSGHLPDIYARTLRDDPTYVNFGSFRYSNSNSLGTYSKNGDASTYFVEYEEGIYSGYKYYETAAAEAAKGNYDGFDYNKAVVYPFGYGLSYTSFSKELAETPKFDASTNEYTFKVKVKNTGSVAGKEVAQIYVNVPWQAGQVEKVHVQLVGFAKTQVLQPNSEETLTITVNRDYFTSYDYINLKSYLLDAGSYNFYVANNSHDWARIDALGSEEKAKLMWTENLASQIVFNQNKRPTDKSLATNKEDDEVNYKFKQYTSGHATGDGFIYDFTRSDFKGSFPTAPKGNDLVLSGDKALQYVKVYKVSDPVNNPITEKQDVNTDKTSYTLQQMRGVDFDDVKWDEYVEQFTVEKMAEMFMNGGWQEVDDEENGVPKSFDADSPYGYYAAALNIGDINKWYCGAPVVAATFNVAIAKELGYAFAEESHANGTNRVIKKGWGATGEEVDGTLITGLYGYGLNGHRSAFGGRNYEYYSEDSILAGKMAAHEAGAASEKGLITFMKHFALNEQETNRQNNGYCAWANEQTLREVYFRSWEIYIKEAKMTIKYNDEDGTLKEKVMPGATGIMTAYNRIGTTYAGASISLTEILRDEFGYVGSTITDAGGNRDTYMTTDFLLRRGGNLTLANNGTDGLYDKSSNTALYWLKDATKHTLYNKANSNCVDGLGAFHYGPSPWRNALTGAWIGIGSACVIDGAVIALIAANVIKIKPKVKKFDGDEF